MTCTPRQHNDRVGLIPPAEMFNRPLPGRLILDADMPFERRVERLAIEKVWGREGSTSVTIVAGLDGMGTTP
jgi:hypothetical protein